MIKTFIINDKATITTAFDELKPKEQSTYTADEIVKMYRVKISLAIKKGYTFKEIAEIFNINNCTISAKDLELSFKKIRGSNKPKTTKKSTITSEA